MSDDKIREAILSGLHRQNPLASLFGQAERNKQADWIMDELKPVLDEQADARVFETAAFTKRQTFAVLWHRYNNDTSAGAYDHTEIGPWLVNEAFPLLYGKGHCFQCHGFVDEQSYLATKMQACGHEACPTCEKED